MASGWFAVAFFLVVVVVEVLVVTGGTANTGSASEERGLEELVKRLQQQIQVMNRRQEEDRDTLRSLMRSRGVDSDLGSLVSQIRGESDALRSDVQRLKTDLERVRERKEDLSAFQQQVVAVRWLQKSMKRLRAEVAEVASAQNVSATLREEQRVQSQLLLVHNDVTWLRLEAEQQRANTERINAALTQTQKDFDELREQLANANRANQLQRDEMLKLRDQLNSMETTRPPAFHVKDNSISDWSGEKSARMRHSGRRLRKALKEVATAQSHMTHQFQQLRHNQSALEANSKRIKQQVMSLANETRSHWKVKESIVEALTARLAEVEASNAAVEVSIRNNTVSSSSVKQLYSSTVQLFEALESVESTCVGGMESLRRELSKMEFNVAQLASSLTIMKEDEKAYEKTRASASAGSVQNETADETSSSFIDFALIKDKRRINRTDDEKMVKYDVETDFGTSLMDVERVPKNSSRLLMSHLAFLEGEMRKWSRQLPIDCNQVDSSIQGSGIYLLRPVSWPRGKILEAFCDVESNGMKKWLVIQRHSDSSLDFDRTWDEYRHGFGDVSSNMWLGNEALHVLTTRAPHVLRVELWDTEGKFWFAEYSEFSVASEADSYRLHISGYHGNASDSLRLHNGLAFSTKDADHDTSSTHCASLYAGGWWYGRCQYVNVNSNLDVGLVWFDARENLWIRIARVQMKIRVRS